MLSIVVLCAGSLVGTAQSAAAEGSVLPDGSLYWGAYISGVPYRTAQLDAFEASIGKQVSIVHWGEPWLSDGKSQPFQTSAFQTVRDRGSIPMLTWGSWDTSKGATQPNFQLASIINGNYDAYITQWAQSAHGWGEPFFLRFDHEMNGGWQFPWAEQANGNRPGEYVRAWQHVHDIFVQQGATNATWVWCPNISGVTTTPLDQLYPGDNYVDWTCADGYNWGTDSGNVWQGFDQVFGGTSYGGYNPHNTYDELLHVAPTKPIMLGEVASSEKGGSKAAWISDMFSELPRDFPRIKAVVWTNWDAGDPNLSWPLESSTDAKNAFAGGLSDSWASSNQFALSPGAIEAPS